MEKSPATSGSIAQLEHLVLDLGWLSDEKESYFSRGYRETKRSLITNRDEKEIQPISKEDKEKMNDDSFTPGGDHNKVDWSGEPSHWGQYHL
jgi:hypothetical protein